MSGVSHHYSICLDSHLLTPPPRQFWTSTVLTRAIMSQTPRHTTFLLKQGCDPNLGIGLRQMRPLMVACFVRDKRKRVGIFKALIEYGADLNLTDIYKRNSMMYACALSLWKEVKLMIKDSDHDLSATDMNGDTLLHMCAKGGRVQVLGIVLQEMQRYRMDISIQNDTYLTPLSLAILNGHHDCARMLHEVGGTPRFSPLRFDYVMSILCNHHQILSIVTVRAIADAVRVGRAFDAKSYFLNSANVLGHRVIPMCRDGDTILPKIELASNGFHITCKCHLSSCEDKEFKFPQVYDVCNCC